MKRIIAALTALLMLSSFAFAEIQMFCVNVGKGDAILIMTGDYTCLIDTGKKGAEDSIRSALEHFGITELDAVFITHTDNDHAGGMKWLKKFPFKSIYASKYYTGVKKKNHPAIKAVKKLNMDVQWLGAGDEISIGAGAVLRVLAPEVPDPVNEDDNSLVMMLESADGRILLTGDMEYGETMRLIESGADLKCDVLKVPNHGDSDACPQELIDACDAELAVISTDPEEKPGTPAPVVLGNLEAKGTEIMVTQDCKCGILVSLSSGEVTGEYLDRW